MASKLVLRQHHPPLPLPPLPFSSFFLNGRRRLCNTRPTILALVSFSLSLSQNPDTLYGPSLRKGRKPSHNFELLLPALTDATPRVDSDPSLIDRDSFVRVFDIAAIRVPAERCFALESRLRGHLLNWPRIRNIARVPGDDIEPEFRMLLASTSSESDEDEKVYTSVSRRIYGRADGDGERLSPVLYRDKLVKSFNCRGFLKFRNLAKISRPTKKTKKKVNDKGVTENMSEKVVRAGKNDFAVVRVVGDVVDESEDMSGLLGERFRTGRWRGPTRLLLLDERYANKNVEELPESIKAVLQGDALQGGNLLCDLVQCTITLFYDYWQLDEILEELLPKEMVIPTSFEIVGHIAHLNLRDEHSQYKKVIAQVVLDKNKPKIKTVVNKTDFIQNDYRTMQLEVLAGNHSLVTLLVENGLRFHVNLATVYWNSRLATERQRLVNGFTKDDIVCDVFAGVGPIAIAAAKKVNYVYANDLNPSAVDYLEHNIVLNKLDRKIEVYNMDGRRFIKAVFTRQGTDPITQVIMNLPNDAVEYLDAFRSISKRKSKITLPKIHVYGFSKADDPELDFRERIEAALRKEVIIVEMHRVRLVAPGKWMLCSSFILPEDFFCA